MSFEPISEQGVREQVARIELSDPFSDVPRQRQILRFLVDEFFAGRGDELTGKRIARDLFSGLHGFVARVEVSRLRSKLAEYYSGQGQAEWFQIVIPKNKENYKPAFELRSFAQAGAQIAPQPRVGVSESEPSLSHQTVSSRASTPLRQRIIWKIAVVFGRTFASIARHPIESVRAVSDTDYDPSLSRIFGLGVIVSTAVLGFAYSAVATKNRTAFRWWPIILIAVILPVVTLLLTLIWRLAGSTPFLPLARTCFHIAAFLILLNIVFMTLSQFLLHRALDGAGPVPFGSTAGDAGAARVMNDLVECSENNSLRACLNSGQPIALTESMIWSRKVFRNPVYWAGISLVFFGLAFQTIYNAAFCRACRSIADPGRHFWSWCNWVVAFLAPGTLNAVMFYGSQSLLGTGSCNVDVFPTATLNPGPVEYSPVVVCADLPLIDAGLVKSQHYSRSEEDHQRGFRAKVGDLVRVRVWLNNGAADNLDPKETTARHVRVSIGAAHPDQNTILLEAQAYGDNARLIRSSDHKYGGDVKITTDVPATAAVDPGTICIARVSATRQPKKADSEELPCEVPAGDIPLPDSSIRDWMAIGDIRPGYANGVVIRLQLRIKATK